MSNNETINATIDLNGNVELDLDGFKGGACREASKAIENALGRVATRKTKSGGGCDVKQKVKT